MISNSSLTLRILSPEGKIIEIVNLSAVNISMVNNRSIGIRPGHAPLIAETKRGAVTYRKSGEEEKIHIHAGVLEIRNDVVTILTTGKVSQTQSDVRIAKDIEFDRLMQTLIKQIMPDRDKPDK